MHSQHTIPAGAILFHGTSTDEAFDELEGPAWVTDSIEVARRFARAGGGPRPRVLTYRVESAIELPIASSPEQVRQLLVRAAGHADFFSAREMAEAVCDAGLPGWFIPNNYPDGGHDILLCDPESHLELVNPIRVRLARNLPLPPFERFDGDRLPGVGLRQQDEGVYWWAWARSPWIQLRVRLHGDHSWEVWAGYPGDRDTWRLRLKGQADSEAEGLQQIHEVLHGDRIIIGGAFPSLPPLVPPALTHAESVALSRAKTERLRKLEERDRLQRIADTDEGEYPELLTDWPMSKSATPGRPWRTIHWDGTIEHRVEREPSWGRNHHLRYFVGGRAVAGLTLKAKRPRRGQSATISTVFTAPSHRRQGYAAALLEHARSYFRRVSHSRELTKAGARWKAGVGNIEPAFLRREFPAPSERQRRLAAAAARVQVSGPVRRVQLARGVVGHFATPPMAERARRDRQTGQRVQRALKQIPRGRRRLVTHRSPLHQPMKGIDVFSGIGGLGRGAELAGARVVWAANHWCEAVTYHAANMPHAEHVCRDVGEIRDWGIVPPHDLGMYGPSCKGFTRALGKREGAQYDAYRATMWTVLEAVEYHLPPYILIENVPEVRNWNLYPVWLQALEVMGYKLTENILNAADAGAAINRTRLFVVGVRQGPALQIPQPTVGPRPFDDVVDWSAGDWRPVEPDERIAAGLKPLKRKWLEVTRRTAQTLRAKRFVIPYFGATRIGFGVDRPLGSITTKQRYYLVDMTKSPGGMRRGVLPREKALAMGFPSNTILPTSATDANIMLGNAVSPWIARYCVSHIEDHRQRFGG